jgi:predicted Zn-dependent peptidase
MKSAVATACGLCTAAAVASAQFPTTPPAAMPISAAQFPPFQTATLSNGVKLLVVSNRRLPVLSISLSFAAGGKYDPSGKAGTSNMVAGLLTKGAGKRDADQIAEAVEGVGGAISANSGSDFLSVDLGLLSENAQLGFNLLADIVARPTFDDKEIELYRTQTLSGLQLEQSQPAAIAGRIFASELYGKHPYGRRADAASVKAIAKADLIAFQKARLRPTGALLVLAGDITLARATTLAEAAFKGWTGAAPAAFAPMAQLPMRGSREIVLVHRAGSVQSNIIAGNLTWAPGDPRHYATVLANKVLGGGGDARLFMILREQKGWTYGAYSAIARNQGTGNFSANAEVRTEVTDSSVAEMLSQFSKIGSEAIPDKEFEDAKSALVGRFPLQVETAEQVAGQVTTAQLLGLPSDYVQTYRQKLAAVTPLLAQQAAKAAIQSDRMLIVVVGDGAKIYEPLRKIAPVRLVNIEGAPMRSEDLVVKATTLDVAVEKLAARSDSFVVLFQGNPLGYQVNRLEKSGAGWKYTEQLSLGPIGGQKTEVTFDGDLTPGSVSQSGQQMGQQAKIDVSYVGGRAKGSATTPGQTGAKTIQVDAEVPKGMIDDNMLQTLLPTFKWAAGAKFSVGVFQSGKGAPVTLTLAVEGEESVTVPAGTFAAWKVAMTGAEQPVTFYVEKAAPNRVVKIAIVGAPIEMRLASPR